MKVDPENMHLLSVKDFLGITIDKTCLEDFVFTLSYRASKNADTYQLLSYKKELLPVLDRIIPWTMDLKLNNCIGVGQVGGYNFERNIYLE